MSCLHEWEVITDLQIELLREKEHEHPTFFDEIKKANTFVEMKIEEISFFIELSAYFLPSNSSYYSCSRESKDELMSSALASAPGVALNSSGVEEVVEEKDEVIKKCCAIDLKMVERLRPFVNSLFLYIRKTTSKQTLRERYFLSDDAITKIYNELCVNPNLFDEIREAESVERLPETSLCSLYEIAKSNIYRNSSERHGSGNRSASATSYCAEDYHVFETRSSFEQIESLVSDG
jgi:hypothetical protein